MASDARNEPRAHESSAQMAERAANGDFSPEVVQWVQTGFAAHLRGDPLDSALGLDSVSRKREAYRLIREIAELLGGDQCGAWQLAERVEKAISYFESRVKPMMFAGNTRVFSPVSQLMIQLQRCRVRFPREQRQIYEKVLKRESANFSRSSRDCGHDEGQTPVEVQPDSRTPNELHDSEPCGGHRRIG